MASRENELPTMFCRALTTSWRRCAARRGDAAQLAVNAGNIFFFLGKMICEPMQPHGNLQGNARGSTEALDLASVGPCCPATQAFWGPAMEKPLPDRLFGEKMPPGGLYLFNGRKTSCASCRVFRARRSRNSASRKKVSQACCTRTGQDISGSDPSSRERQDF